MLSIELSLGGVGFVLELSIIVVGDGLNCISAKSSISMKLLTVFVHFDCY